MVATKFDMDRSYIDTSYSDSRLCRFEDNLFRNMVHPVLIHNSTGFEDNLLQNMTHRTLIHNSAGFEDNLLRNMAHCTLSQLYWFRR